MKDLTSASQLARTMVRLGSEAGVTTSALLTDMSEPLGLAVGNAMEVAESLEVLAGGGPADVVELTLALAREMVRLAGLSVDPAEVLASGAAMDTWRSMVAAQGGDPDAPLPVPGEVEVLAAPVTGVIAKMDAMSVGMAAWRLGAGRARKEDAVQSAAGVLCRAKPGDEIVAGAPLFELHTDTPDRIPAAAAELAAAVEIVPLGRPVPRRAIVMNTIRR